MADREKVLTWLEICGKNRDCSGNCPYGDGSGEYEDHLCREDLMADALALLKEQEAVEHEAVKPKIDAFGHPYCPKCKILVYETWEFCPHCGQELKWE